MVGFDLTVESAVVTVLVDGVEDVAVVVFDIECLIAAAAVALDFDVCSLSMHVRLLVDCSLEVKILTLLKQR